MGVRVGERRDGDVSGGGESGHDGAVGDDRGGDGVVPGDPGGGPAPAGSGPLPAEPVAGTAVYYHTDAIGSVRLVTDQAGQVVLPWHDYLPFGQEWPASSPDRRLFTGEERDQETQFDYFGARYFSAGIGRFTTVDPSLDVEKALVDPQRWARYPYVKNNPLKFIDPDGRDPLLVTGGIGAAVYAAWNAYVNVQQGRPWYENIGVEASKGFIVGATLGLAAPALAPVDIGFGTAGGALAESAVIGANREIAVARLVGGELAGEPGVGMSVTVKGLGTTGVDVIGEAGEYIGVGGPAKGLNPADFGRKLQILKAAADQAGVTAQYALEKGTPRWVVEFAKKRLGEENVFEFEP